MNRNGTFVGLAIVLLFVLLPFQNCGRFEVQEALIDSTSQISQANLPSFKEMSLEEARALARPYEQSCSTLRVESSSYTLHTPGTALTVEGDQYMVASVIPSAQGLGNLIVFGINPSGTKCTGGTDGTKCAGEVVQGDMGAMLGSIGDFKGNVLLCGMSVKAISERTFGHIVIEEGSVHSISGFEGDLIILGGAFPAEISNFKGRIVVKTGTGEYVGRTY